MSAVSLELRTVAALYVERDGAYYGLEGVDPWDELRDARRYDGPHPVVAHPPCSTWCQLASVNEARWGSTIGADDGCFAAALQAVRSFGGVLEHPAYSLALGVHSGECVGRRRLDPLEARGTPTLFRELLLELARSS